MTNRIVLAAAAAALFAGCGGSEKAGGKGGSAFRTAPVARMNIVRTVEATGTVQPRNTASGIPVGAQVNGRIVRLFVDYNSPVTNGQVVALIDPLVYESNYRSAVAKLHVNEANVEVRRAGVRTSEAELVLAEKTYARKKALADKSMASVADLDSAVEALDKARAGLESAKANLSSAEASVEQSRAEVAKTEADLAYCTIRSPVNGIVIDRKVEEGETVVANMNAVPVLTIAEDLKTVWVKATIPEADVGNVRVGQTVTFTADAYRRRFTGRVVQIRRAATETNNVVTFPVIIEAENPDEMLFPGMTVTLAIETARAENVVGVAAAALRFRPREGTPLKTDGEVPRGRKLWLVEPDGSLRPVKVADGVSDDTFTEVKAEDGTALEGREAVVGYATKATAAAGAGAENPFMPKMPQRNKNKGTAPEPRK